MFSSEKDIFRFEKDSPLQYASFTLHQISDIQTAPGSICPLHVQFCDEISYLVSGRCSHKVNNTTVDLSPGDLLLLRTDDVHAYSTDAANPARIFNLGVSLSETEQSWLSSAWSEWYSRPSPVLLHDAKPVEDIFIHMLDELADNSFGWEYALRLYSEQLLLTVCRMLNHVLVQAYLPESDKEAEKRLIYSLIQYMDTHITESDTLTRLPEIFHYSTSHLSHVFKRAMGVSLSDYYRQRRFSHAAQLLAQGRFSVTEVAKRMDYQTVHAFSKAFHKFYGISPSQYINTLSKQDTP